MKPGGPPRLKYYYFFFQLTQVVYEQALPLLSSLSGRTKTWQFEGMTTCKYATVEY